MFAAQGPPVSLTPVANLPPVCTLTCKYLREFSNKFEVTLMLFSGAWKKMITEKQPEAKKSRDPVPFMV
jgi:hypothetical protein